MVIPCVQTSLGDMINEGLWKSLPPDTHNSLSIQFNSAICTRQLMNITLARTAKKKLKRIIKYMNEKRKKSINYEKKVRFHFCSEGVERESGSRDHASPPGASSTRQMRRSRTLVDPVSLFWFVGRTEVGPTSWMNACWHDRRKLKPECTDRRGNRELGHGDILETFVDEEVDLIVHPIIINTQLKTQPISFRVRYIQYIGIRRVNAWYWIYKISRLTQSDLDGGIFKSSYVYYPDSTFPLAFPTGINLFQHCVTL